MSTFNVLNNQEIAQAFSTSGPEMAQAQLDEHSSISMTDAPPLAKGESRGVQKVGILSGTKELK